MDALSSHPKQSTAALGRFSYNENNQQVLTVVPSPRETRSAPKRNPILAAHLGLGRDENKGPLAQLAQSEIDESSRKPTKGKKGAARSIKAPIKPRAKKSNKSTQVASKQAADDSNLDTTTEAFASDIKGWTRTKPRLEYAGEKQLSMRDQEAVVDVDSEAIPEVHVSIQRAKRKLDAFLFSDGTLVPSEENAVTGAEENNLEEVVRYSSVTGLIVDDMPSAAYTEDELVGDFWQNNALAEGDMPDYEGDVPDYMPKVFNDKSLSTDVDGVEQVADASSGPVIEDLQDIYEAVLNADGAVAELDHDTTASGAHANAEMDTFLSDPFEDELEDDAFKDVIIDELPPDIEVQSHDKVETPKKSSSVKGLQETTSEDAGFGELEEFDNIALSDFEFDEDETWITESRDFPVLPTNGTALNQPPKPSPQASVMVPQSDNKPPKLPTPPASSSPITIPDSDDSVYTETSTPATPFVSPAPQIARTPHPQPARDRSSILGLSSSPVLRTCFRVGSALKLGSNAARCNQHVIIELYARVLSSNRDESTGQQFFRLVDLMNPEKPPVVEAVYEGWKEGEPWRYDSGLLICEKEEMRKESRVSGEVKQERLCRSLGRVVREGKGWMFKIMNVWKAEWEDVEWVRGIYGCD